VPDTVDALLASCGIDACRFRQERIQPLIDNGWDKILARFYALIEESKRQGNKITQQYLAKFGEELAPFNGVTKMLEGDRRRIELTYSLLFSLPGTPLLRYGEEIGMGDDLSLFGRDSVRTLMQWSDAPNGGFSTASPDTLPRPTIAEGEYGYKQLNVTEQQRNPNSLINWMEHLIRIRKQCPELGWGKWQILETDESGVFAHSCEGEGKAVIAVHNLSNKPRTVTLKSHKYTHLTDLFGDRQYETLDGDLQSIPLEAYGYRWFQVTGMSQ